MRPRRQNQNNNNANNSQPDLVEEEDNYDDLDPHQLMEFLLGGDPNQNSNSDDDDDNGNVGNIHQHQPMQQQQARQQPMDTPDLFYSRTVKYLGVTFDSKLRFPDHMRDTKIKTTSIISAMYPLFARSSELTTRTKLLLYKQIVRPVITYGSPVWTSAAAIHHKPLQVAQNRALKTILGLRRCHPTTDTHSRAGIPMIRDYIDRLNASFFERCATATAPLINQLAT